MTIINRYPTIEDPAGSYRFIDDNGIYWGTFYVGTNWCGERFVTDADPSDGLPF
jgi:hypothetical protein